MASLTKSNFLKELQEKLGNIRKLSNSLSLFEVGDSVCRIYTRYSKIHNRKQAFYGIRKEDLKQLDGYNSFLCFLWDNQKEPVFIPYIEFEEIFNFLQPASDGQIKASIFVQENGMELYIANSGRFNIEGYLGWNYLIDSIDYYKADKSPEFSHSQIQSLLTAIGDAKGYNIWIPPYDKNKLDSKHQSLHSLISSIPERYNSIIDSIKEVDVLWMQRGSSQIKALFEIEHSTPIYSGLLRFNDLHLSEPNLKPRYSIVSNDVRRALFIRQINRPTFKVSGLIEICNFLNYKDVYYWFTRISRGLK